MIAVDTNILVYAHREDAPFHRPSLDRLVELAESGRPWAIPWPCVHEFLAVVTHPRIFNPPSSMARAVTAMDVWIESPGCELIGEGPGYWAKLRKSGVQARLCGAQIHDARIAAICLHNGVEALWTADRDFSRYPDLKTVNPLRDAES